MKRRIKILIYLYYPFYDNHLAGGVQVWLRNLIESIVRSHKQINIKIICPDGKGYKFPSDIDVEHTLVDMERDFLEPKVIYQNLQKIKDLEKEADIIWLIDRNFPVQSDKPKLLSLNTLCYEREAMSIYQSSWDNLVVLSNFVKNQIINYIDKPKNVFTIPCYVDPIFLKINKDKEKILGKYFSYNPKLKYLLFPHRADSSKGHLMAIDILKKIIEIDDNYRLLIPEPSLAKYVNVSREREYIKSLKKYVKRQGLGEFVIFHKWISYSDIPTYYSIGECTLFLSKLPETFGITLLNSISVGTPVLSYGVGALNEVVPPGKGHVNIRTEGDAVSHILEGRMGRGIAHDKKYVIKNYVLEEVVDKYVKLFYQMMERKNE